MTRTDKYYSQQAARVKGHTTITVEQRSVLTDRRSAVIKRKPTPTITVAKALQFLKDTKC